MTGERRDAYQLLSQPSAVGGAPARGDRYHSSVSYRTLDFYSSSNVTRGMDTKLIAWRRLKRFRRWIEQSACGFCSPVIDSTPIRKVLLFFCSEYVTTMVFLSILGTLTAFLALGMDEAINYILYFRKALGEEEEYTWPYKFVVFTGFSLLCLFVSAACVQILSLRAKGSGIPEMKSILSGHDIPDFLTFKTLIAKVFGLTLSYGGGLAIGKEGPFVHMASAGAAVLLRIPYFKHLRTHPYMRLQMLAAAAAAGVSATFGAPFGGVLFSIEVTATYYLLSNFWKSVFCAMVGSVVFYFSRQDIVALFETRFDPPHIVSETRTELVTRLYDPVDFIAFACVGIIGGVVGAAFISLTAKLMKARRSHWLFGKESNYSYVLLFGFLTTAITFPWIFMRDSMSESIQDFLATTPLNHAKWVDNLPLVKSNIDWFALPGDSLFSNLLFFVILKLLLTVGSIACPVPAGLFTPVFVVGAALGRYVGEIVRGYRCVGFDPYNLEYDHYTREACQVLPGGYAVVGAAALTAGVTRTLSTAVIVFELTGQLSHMLPVMMSVVVAILVGNRFNANVYQTILRLQHLPFLSVPNTIMGGDDYQGDSRLEEVDRRSRMHFESNVRAVDIMRRNVQFITLQSTAEDLQALHDNFNFSHYPLVDSTEEMHLLGTVSRKTLSVLLLHLKAQSSLPASASVSPLVSGAGGLGTSAAPSSSPPAAAAAVSGGDDVVLPVAEEVEETGSAEPMSKRLLYTEDDVYFDYDSEVSGADDLRGSRVELLAGADDENSAELLARFSVPYDGHKVVVPYYGRLKYAIDNVPERFIQTIVASSKTRPFDCVGFVRVWNTPHPEVIVDLLHRVSRQPTELLSTGSLAPDDAELEAAVAHGRHGRSASVRASAATEEWTLRTETVVVLPKVLDRDGFHAVVAVDPSPFRMGDLTAASRAKYMFVMLGCRFCYVLTAGRLVGVITRRDLIECDDNVTD